jgi:hypothetical protein
MLFVFHFLASFLHRLPFTFLIVFLIFLTTNSQVCSCLIIIDGHVSDSLRFCFAYVQNIAIFNGFFWLY